MKFRGRAIALFAVLSLIVAACSSGATTEDPGATTTQGSGVSEEPVKVGMALPGPRNDQGFSEAHLRGLTLAQDEFVIEISVIDDSNTPDATVSALTNLAADNDLVIGVGSEYDEAGRVVAPKFPDVTFMMVNGSVYEDVPNLYAYGISQGVPAYIATFVAAAIEGVDTIGYIGGLEIPPVTDSAKAIEQAAEDTGLTSMSTITGDFNDIPLAKSAADAQIAEGADLIYGLVDAGFTGVIQAAEASDSNPYLISVIFPRCDDYDNLVATSIVGADELVNSMVSDFLNGTLPDEALYYGVEDPAIQRVELCPNFQTDELQKVIDDTTQGINDGSITLPEGL